MFLENVFGKLYLQWELEGKYLLRVKNKAITATPMDIVSAFLW